MLPGGATVSSPSGSLLSMVKSRALMVAEVLRYDQTLPRKPGARPT
jgi:hypothetical protein